jgi:DNA-binding FadR family transcriptional regulator
VEEDITGQTLEEWVENFYRKHKNMPSRRPTARKFGTSEHQVRKVIDALKAKIEAEQPEQAQSA